jgi:hypothetical protein
MSGIDDRARELADFIDGTGFDDVPPRQVWEPVIEAALQREREEAAERALEAMVRCYDGSGTLKNHQSMKREVSAAILASQPKG